MEAIEMQRISPDAPTTVAPISPDAPTMVAPISQEALIMASPILPGPPALGASASPDSSSGLAREMRELDRDWSRQLANKSNVDINTVAPWTRVTEESVTPVATPKKKWYIVPLAILSCVTAVCLPVLYLNTEIFKSILSNQELYHYLLFGGQAILALGDIVVAIGTYHKLNGMMMWYLANFVVHILVALLGVPPLVALVIVIDQHPLQWVLPGCNAVILIGIASFLVYIKPSVAKIHP